MCRAPFEPKQVQVCTALPPAPAGQPDELRARHGSKMATLTRFLQHLDRDVKVVA